METADVGAVQIGSESAPSPDEILKVVALFPK